MTDDILDESEVYLIRKQKLQQLREEGFTFPNDFKPQHHSAAIMAAFEQEDKASLEQKQASVCVAGRIVLRRVMGKASFFHIQDATGRIQVYLRANDLPDTYEAFKHWDLGDIVGVEGVLFKTNTNELTIHATKVALLTKSLRPLPDKFHGLASQEMRYRKRYVDLIANEETRKRFLLRTAIIRSIRDFMDEQGFLEVETPMLHPIPGGAQAKPFETHHNALDMPMFLRIAPELYLKRLVVGGFERVYEINRNFRNEGVSTRHNPEFTMMEFYQAYASYEDLMVFTESLLHHVCDKALGTRQVPYQGGIIDFDKPFAKLTISEAILAHHPDIQEETLTDIDALRRILEKYELSYQPGDSLAKLQMILFEERVEHQLIQPTFVTAYPTEVSPLARRNDKNPTITDRFEFFIAGRELANGFSELNDAEDQAERFRMQVAEKDAGDDEAMHYDSDYIEALEYGLPPTAGEGIGIDRLIMLLTDTPTIRDVVLFPHLRHQH